MPKAPPSDVDRVIQYATNLIVASVIRIALALPYQFRVRMVGRLMQHIIGPIAGYRQRALSNLELIWPDRPLAERKRIAAGCMNNMGRTLIENYSQKDFPARLANNPLTGAGVAAWETAIAEQRPVILVTGHYGNYEAVRAALAGRGHAVGGLYRNMTNPYFNAHYVKTMETFGGPVFAQGRKGTKGFVRHLKQGGQLVLLFDQHVRWAPTINFLGRPAHTATSAAELSLRYDALLLPFYGIRQADGLSFETVLEAPIPPSTPEEMTQAITDTLNKRIEQDPSQWFWVHRRWRVKVKR